MLATTKLVCQIQKIYPLSLRIKLLIYKKEIDGLRAVSIIFVILFHAEIDLFKGGFIGVDIFFVISGYLITGILIKSFLNKQSFFAS